MKQLQNCMFNFREPVLQGVSPRTNDRRPWQALAEGWLIGSQEACAGAPRLQRLEAQGPPPHDREPADLQERAAQQRSQHLHAQAHFLRPCAGRVFTEVCLAGCLYSLSTYHHFLLACLEPIHEWIRWIFSIRSPIFVKERFKKNKKVFENYLVPKTLQKYTGNFSDRIRNKFF